ncbi:MAG: ADP-glyceromanno-heptose 6-epimerase [Bacteroidota bacterium]
MIIVTGAAGFIGSAMVSSLNNKGLNDVIAVDDFSRQDKNRNLTGKSLIEKIHRDHFFDWALPKATDIDFVFHLGARTDTAEFDRTVFNRLNLNYSQAMWKFCAEHQIPLIYASSAATYGMGEHGYQDKHELVPRLKPLNPYGESKNDFDKWVLNQDQKPPFWAGLKFFNVYGPNEYHKSRMASVIFHAYHQIMDTGAMKLFRSHHPEVKDGEQRRDFVYVKDVVSMMLWLMEQQPESALYNVGTGKARTFLDLVRAVFKAMDVPENIGFIDTPKDIRDKYQYFTEADMAKIRKAGYQQDTLSLEEGIADYVKNYLIPGHYY